MGLPNSTKPSIQRRITGVLALVLSLCLSTLVWLMWSMPENSPVEAPASMPPQQSATVLPSASNIMKPSVIQSSPPSSHPAKQWPNGGQSAPAAMQQKNLQINIGVLHDENATFNTIFLNADGITLKNKVVLSDLVIADSVNNGTITLENIVVKGRILVNGAQALSLMDVSAAQVIAQRTSGTTDYIIGGATTIHRFTARNQLTIDQSGLFANYAGVKALYTEAGTPVWQKVVLVGGSIDQAEINDATNLLLESGTWIDAVTANAPTHIGGKGTVNLLKVRSEEVTYERSPRNIEIEGSYDRPNQQSWAIGETAPTSGGSRSKSSPVKLKAPQGLTITAAEAEKTISLSFESVINVSDFTISYSVTNGDSPENTINAQITTTTNSHFLTHTLIGQPGTDIRFKVRAEAGSSRYLSSDYSSEYTKSVKVLSAPDAVSLSYNSGKLVLGFTPGVGTSANAHVAVLSTEGQENITLSLPAGVNSGEFEDPIPGATYTVSVHAVGDGRMSLSSPALSAVCAVPELPDVSNLVISQDGGEISVTFTKAEGVSNYTVALSYEGMPLTQTASGVNEDEYTYLFAPPAAIEDGGEYRASVLPQGGTQSTAIRTVTRRESPRHVAITSSALDTIDFSYTEVAGMSYTVVSATHNTLPLSVTSEALSVSGLVTAAGDTFNFSVITLGDGMFYADSFPAAANTATVTALSDPLSPTFSGDKDILYISFNSTNFSSPHEVVLQTWDEASGWVDGISFTLEAKNADSQDTTVDTPNEPARLRFGVKAKATNALQIDSATTISNELSLVRLAQAQNLAIVDTEEVNSVRFAFDAVADATAYIISYTLSDSSTQTLAQADYATVTAENVTLPEGVTITQFTVTALAEETSDVIYLESVADSL